MGMMDLQSVSICEDLLETATGRKHYATENLTGSNCQISVQVSFLSGMVHLVNAP
jgi:hypothetical protein